MSITQPKICSACIFTLSINSISYAPWHEMSSNPHLCNPVLCMECQCQYHAQGGGLELRREITISLDGLQIAFQERSIGVCYRAPSKKLAETIAGLGAF